MFSHNRRRSLIVPLACAAIVATGCSAFKSSDDNGNEAATKITVDVIAGGFTVPDNDAIKPVIDEAVGVNLQLRLSTNGKDYYNKLSAALASGTAGDLFQVDRTHLQQLIDQDLVMSVDELLTTKLKTYHDWVGPDAQRIATFDGKVYGLAGKLQAGPYGSYWIRKDWLDRLKLTVPTTTEELQKVALAFTKDDPDGNGKDDTFGIVGAGTTTFNSLFPAFGSGGPGNFYVEDGKIVNGYADPDTKTALSYVAGLFKLGVVVPDTLTLDHTHAMDLAIQGKAGIVPADFSQMATAAPQIKQAQPKAEWEQMTPPKGPSGQGAALFDAANTKVFAIPKSVQGDKLDKVIALINYLSSKEGNNLVSYGIKGTDWTLVNGAPKLTEQALAKTTDERGFTWLYQLTGRSDSAYLKRGGSGYTDEQVDFALKQPRFKTYNSLVSAPEGYNPADADRFAETGLVQFLTGQEPLSGYGKFLSTLETTFKYKTYVESGVTTLTELGVAN